MEERVAKDLETTWVPRLRDLRQTRQHTIHFIQLIVFGLMGSMIYQYIIHNTFQLSAGISIILLVGLLLLVIRCLGTVQGCNDALVAIECYVYMRDSDGLTNALT